MTNHSQIVTPQEVADFHTNADIDSDSASLHHTLGLGITQASPGGHTHNGRDSKLLKPLIATTVTGSRSGGAALTSLLTQLAAQGIIINSTTA